MAGVRSVRDLKRMAELQRALSANDIAAVRRNNKSKIERLLEAGVLTKRDIDMLRVTSDKEIEAMRR